MPIRRLAIVALAIALLSGCGSRSQEKPVPSETAAPIGHTGVVLQKETKGAAFVLEIGGDAGEHKYVEVPEEAWIRINVNDSVTLDDRDQLIKINGAAVE